MSIIKTNSFSGYRYNFFLDRFREHSLVVGVDDCDRKGDGKGDSELDGQGAAKVSGDDASECESLGDLDLDR